MDVYNFVSLCGLGGIIAFAWLFSSDRRHINWHVVVWGLGLQMLFAWLVFVFPPGVKFFLWINEAIVQMLSAALAGTQFVFGRLGVPPGMESPTGESSLGFILAFQAFPTIIFFSALMAILYYYNIIPRLIRGFAYVFSRLMKVSGAESLCTASNIFVGVESAFTVRPYLKDMTRSELCTVLTAGMATVASNVLAIYVLNLQRFFPMIAGHLVSASILSAPAALLISKILLPEREQPRTLGEDIPVVTDKEQNLFEAIIQGAHAGVKLIVGIVALLIAMLGLLALGDQILGAIGALINRIFHLSFVLSFKNILGVIFYPMTLMLGIPPSDAAIAARIIGERTVATEVVSYQNLALALEEGTITHPRTVVITTYALCGFAHVASLAIFIGGISALVPEKTRILAQIGFRSLFAATLACLMTAGMAGLFFTDGTFILKAIP